MGTPDFAVPTLVEIVGRGHDVAAVYTRAPKPAGARHGAAAEPGRARGAPLRPRRCSRPRRCGRRRPKRAMRAHGADAAVVVAYGLILPKPILDAFPLGCFNLHASLLPRWRGAAPINRAIMAGDAETGVMVMKMEEGLDTGPVAMAERVPIGARHDRRRPARPARPPRRRPDGARARRARARLAELTPQPDDGVTYAAKIDKDETRIDWARPWQRGARPHPRPVAVSGRLVRDRGRRRPGPRQGAAHDQRRRARARPARCSTTA